jgi:hypothetical protein
MYHLLDKIGRRHYAWSTYSGLDLLIYTEVFLGSSMKRSWGFLIPKYYYNYGFENFYATVIQRAYRNYKKRPESSAKWVWEAVRNDGTSDRKKFLGILRKGQMVINPETQKEYAIACNEFYALFRESYSKYIGIINPVKLTPPYEEYIYCSSSR